MVPCGHLTAQSQETRIQIANFRGTALFFPGAEVEGSLQLPKAIVGASLLVGVALITVNLVLLQQNRRLAYFERLYRVSAEVSAGDALPAFHGRDLRGQPLTVSYGPREPWTLFLVFARKCGACEANWPAWREILQKTSGTSNRIVAVNLEDELSADYVSQVGLQNTEVVAASNLTSALAYRFRFTPQTVLVRPDGKVEAVWTGILNAVETATIERAVSAGASVRQ